jgi:hypothetical protein
LDVDGLHGKKNWKRQFRWLLIEQSTGQSNKPRNFDASGSHAAALSEEVQRERGDSQKENDPGEWHEKGRRKG